MTEPQEFPEFITRSEEQLLAVKRLAALQNELRGLAAAAVADARVAPATLAAAWNISTSSFGSFLKGELVVAGGKLLTNMINHLKRTDLGEAIVEQAKTINNDQIAGLAKLSASSIDLVFALRIACVKAGFHPQNTPGVREFASLFGSQAEMVRYAILANVDVVQSIDESATMTILTLLTDDETLNTETKKLRETIAARKQAGVDRLNELFTAMATYYKTKAEIADAIGKQPYHLQKPLAGTAKEATVDELIRLFEQKLAKLERRREPVQQPVSDPKVADLPSAPKVSESKKPNRIPDGAVVKTQAIEQDPGEALLELLGGETQGDIKFVLTQNSIRKKRLKVQNPATLATAIREAIEFARMMINVGINVELDADQRAMVNHQIGELLLSIQGFSTKNPSVLAQYLEAQRMTWAKIPNGKEGQNPNARTQR